MKSLKISLSLQGKVETVLSEKNVCFFLLFGRQTKFFVQFRAVGKASVDNRHNVRLRTDAEGFFGIRWVFPCSCSIDQAHNVLVEHVAQAVFLHREAHFKPVARAERSFEAHFQIGDHDVNAAFVEFGKFDTFGFYKLMAACLGVVLIDGIVDDALEVAFVVANAHFVNKNRLHFL